MSSHFTQQSAYEFIIMLSLGENSRRVANRFVFIRLCAFYDQLR